MVRDLKNAISNDRPREAKRQGGGSPSAPGGGSAPSTNRLGGRPSTPRRRAGACASSPRPSRWTRTVARGSDPDADAMAFARSPTRARAERLVALLVARDRRGGGGAAASASPASPASPGRGARWGLVPGDFPPGIELGGPGGSSPLVVAAVETLRVMHVNDLRELQSAVDALLVQMQVYTGDPRTDAALGRVGEG